MVYTLPRGRERRSWLLVSAWMVVLYSTVPVARRIQAFVDDRWGRQVFTSGVLAVLIVGLGLALLYAYRHRSLVTGKRAAWLVGIAVVYAYFTMSLQENPEESLHFVEYGILAYLLFRALSHRVRDPSIYLAATLLGAIVGLGEEVLQWATPRRYFDFRDVALNTLSVLLVQMAVDKGFKPAVIQHAFRPRSLSRVCAIAATLVVMVGLCLSNTPPVIRWYTGPFRFLSFLRGEDNIMTEYGYAVHDPEIGLFFTRFTVERLKETDARRAREAARILDAYGSPAQYPLFLKLFTPFNDPFLHELRVHLFRRDRYRGAAWKYRDDPPEYVNHLTIAHRENQILEKYFGRTLGLSRHVLAARDRALLESRYDRTARYVSAVSASLITSFRPWQVWLAVLVLLVALKMGRLLCARAEARRGAAS
jgi:glycopeptide antibiotics resistance protein